MIRIISALLLSISISCAIAQEAQPLQLADDAPDRHVVVPGDTLWGLSSKFLQQPYRWPELWRMNKEQIKNPHRIYPGQVLVLDRSGGDPQLRIAGTVKLDPKVYSETIAEQISSIPPQVIEPFLSQPLVVEEDGLRNAPRVVATQEDRVYVGPGNVAYVAGLDSKVKLWQIYRPSKPLLDPQTREPIAHEAFYLGSAKLLRAGDPATVEIVTAKEEIGRDDRLVPFARPESIAYVPHAPAAKIDGQIVSIYGGVKEAGRNAVITINRGKRDGLEVGHVLALHRHGGSHEVRIDGEKTTVRLPAERYGLAFVFRAFDRISYALVMNVGRPVVVADIVSTP